MIATLLVAAWLTQNSDYHGYIRHDFQIAGRSALIVEPKVPKAGNPWVWRAEFFDHRPEFDLAMLMRGYRLAFIDVGNTFGCPAAMDTFGEFYRFVVNQGLGKKPILEGLSRGGLYAYQFAAKNPDKVMAIYGDAPVCDFKTWPYGQRGGKRSDSDWQELINVYGFPSESAALAYPFNPIDNLAPLAAAKIPIIHVVGDADEVVPMAENTGLLESRYKALRGVIEVIHKPGGLHHPHGLDDPTPIVKFVEKHARDTQSSPSAPLIAAPNPESRYDSAGWQGRSWLDQHRESLAIAIKVNPRVVLLGDSITQSWGDPSRHTYAAATDVWNREIAPLRAVNMGLSGDRVQNVLWRIDHGALSDMNPEFVVLHIGTNNLTSDEPDEIVKGIRKAFESIRKKSSSAQVILTGLFPVGVKADDPRRVMVRQINDKVKRLADGKTVHFLDIGPSLMNSDGSLDLAKGSSDGIHLSHGGYEIWGVALRKLIESKSKAKAIFEKRGR